MAEPIDEARLDLCEERANETVRRCTHCDAPARWWMVGARGASVWLCDEHNTRPPHATRIEAVELDALDLVAEVRRLTAALATVTTERDRLQRACDEGLPREYLECPACGRQHIEGPRHDNPAIDGRTRPHHTHRCYGCGHVWDAGRWSFGADVPKPADALATARREGAEGMRRAAGQVCHDVYLENPSAAVAVCIDAIRALPLDGDGGAE